MKEVSFIIPGRPIGKARARVNRNGHCWTPDKTTDYERKIKMAYWTKYRNQMFAGDKALAIDIVLYYVRTKNMSKKKRMLAQKGILRPLVKPDIDNVIKAILDGLNGLAFEDDKQIVQVTSEKWYDGTDKNDGFAEVTIKGWDEYDESGLGNF